MEQATCPGRVAVLGCCLPLGLLESRCRAMLKHRGEQQQRLGGHRVLEAGLLRGGRVLRVGLGISSLPLQHLSQASPTRGPLQWRDGRILEQLAPECFCLLEPAQQTQAGHRQRVARMHSAPRPNGRRICGLVSQRRPVDPDHGAGEGIAHGLRTRHGHDGGMISLGLAL